MDMITVTAKTLDEAITKALIELETTSDNLDYTIVEKGSSGLFGLFSKNVVIRAKKKHEDDLEDLFASITTVNSPIKENKEPKKEKDVPKRENKKEPKKEQKQKQEPRQRQENRQKPEKSGKAEKIEKTERPEKAETRQELKSQLNAGEEKTENRKPIDVLACEKAAKDFLDQVFSAMGMEVQLDTSFSESDRELTVDMSGADMGILIGKRGQTLDSLQYLVSLVVNKECEGYLRVKLDTENYRARRKETLETLAKNIAYKVKRTRRSVSLEPMNPYERRIIHAALQNDKYVVTRSEGEDPFRHVVVLLKRENRENRENRGNRNNQQS